MSAAPRSVQNNMQDTATIYALASVASATHNSSTPLSSPSPSFLESHSTSSSSSSSLLFNVKCLYREPPRDPKLIMSKAKKKKDPESRRVLPPLPPNPSSSVQLTSTNAPTNRTIACSSSSSYLDNKNTHQHPRDAQELKKLSVSAAAARSVLRSKRDARRSFVESQITQAVHDALAFPMPPPQKSSTVHPHHPMDTEDNDNTNTNIYATSSSTSARATTAAAVVVEKEEEEARDRDATTLNCHIPTGRCCHTAVAVDDRYVVFVFGGSTESTFNDSFVFDTLWGAKGVVVRRKDNRERRKRRQGQGREHFPSRKNEGEERGEGRGNGNEMDVAPRGGGHHSYKCDHVDDLHTDTEEEEVMEVIDPTVVREMLSCPIELPQLLHNDAYNDDDRHDALPSKSFSSRGVALQPTCCPIHQYSDSNETFCNGTFGAPLISTNKGKGKDVEEHDDGYATSNRCLGVPVPLVAASSSGGVPPVSIPWTEGERGDGEKVGGERGQALTSLPIGSQQRALSEALLEVQASLALADEAEAQRTPPHFVSIPFSCPSLRWTRFEGLCKPISTNVDGSVDCAVSAVAPRLSHSAVLKKGPCGWCSDGDASEDSNDDGPLASSSSSKSFSSKERMAPKRGGEKEEGKKSTRSPHRLPSFLSDKYIIVFGGQSATHGQTNEILQINASAMVRYHEARVAKMVLEAGRRRERWMREMRSKAKAQHHAQMRNGRHIISLSTEEAASAGSLPQITRRFCRRKVRLPPIPLWEIVQPHVGPEGVSTSTRVVTPAVGPSDPPQPRPQTRQTPPTQAEGVGTSRSQLRRDETKTRDQDTAVERESANGEFTNSSSSTEEEEGREKETRIEGEGNYWGDDQIALSYRRKLEAKYRALAESYSPSRRNFSSDMIDSVVPRPRSLHTAVLHHLPSSPERAGNKQKNSAAAAAGTEEAKAEGAEGTVKVKVRPIMFVLCGWGPDRCVYNDLWAFNTVTLQWSVVPFLGRHPQFNNGRPAAMPVLRAEQRRRRELLALLPQVQKTEAEAHAMRLRMEDLLFQCYVLQRALAARLWREKRKRRRGQSTGSESQSIEEKMSDTHRSAAVFCALTPSDATVFSQLSTAYQQIHELYERAESALQAKVASFPPCMFSQERRAFLTVPAHLTGTNDALSTAHTQANDKDSSDDNNNNNNKGIEVSKPFSSSVLWEKMPPLPHNITDLFERRRNVNSSSLTIASSENPLVPLPAALGGGVYLSSEEVLERFRSTLLFLSNGDGDNDENDNHTCSIDNEEEPHAFNSVEFPSWIVDTSHAAFVNGSLPQSLAQHIMSSHQETRERSPLSPPPSSVPNCASSFVISVGAFLEDPRAPAYFTAAGKKYLRGRYEERGRALTRCFAMEAERLRRSIMSLDGSLEAGREGGGGDRRRSGERGGRADTPPNFMALLNPPGCPKSGLYGHSAVTHGGYMYVFGGATPRPNIYSNALYRFDFNTFVWTEVRASAYATVEEEGEEQQHQQQFLEFPAPRYSASLAAWGDYLYLFGGDSHNCERYYGDLWRVRVEVSSRTTTIHHQKRDAATSPAAFRWQRLDTLMTSLNISSTDNNNNTRQGNSKDTAGGMSPSSSPKKSHAAEAMRHYMNNLSPFILSAEASRAPLPPPPTTNNSGSLSLSSSSPSSSPFPHYTDNNQQQQQQHTTRHSDGFSLVIETLPSSSSLTSLTPSSPTTQNNNLFLSTSRPTTTTNRDADITTATATSATPTNTAISATTAAKAARATLLLSTTRTHTSHHRNNIDNDDECRRSPGGGGGGEEEAISAAAATATVTTEEAAATASKSATKGPQSSSSSDAYSSPPFLSTLKILHSRCTVGSFPCHRSGHTMTVMPSSGSLIFFGGERPVLDGTAERPETADEEKKLSRREKGEAIESRRCLQPTTLASLASSLFFFDDKSSDDDDDHGYTKGSDGPPALEIAQPSNNDSRDRRGDGNNNAASDDQHVVSDDNSSDAAENDDGDDGTSVVATIADVHCITIGIGGWGSPLNAHVCRTPATTTCARSIRGYRSRNEYGISGSSLALMAARWLSCSLIRFKTPTKTTSKDNKVTVRSQLALELKSLASSSAVASAFSVKRQVGSGKRPRGVGGASDEQCEPDHDALSSSSSSSSRAAITIACDPSITTATSTTTTRRALDPRTTRVVSPNFSSLSASVSPKTEAEDDCFHHQPTPSAAGGAPLLPSSSSSAVLLTLIDAYGIFSRNTSNNILHSSSGLSATCGGLLSATATRSGRSLTLQELLRLSSAIRCAEERRRLANKTYSTYANKRGDRGQAGETTTTTSVGGENKRGGAHHMDMIMSEGARAWLISALAMAGVEVTDAYATVNSSRGKPTSTTRRLQPPPLPPPPLFSDGVRVLRVDPSKVEREHYCCSEARGGGSKDRKGLGGGRGHHQSHNAHIPKASFVIPSRAVALLLFEGIGCTCGGDVGVGYQTPDYF